MRHATMAGQRQLQAAAQHIALKRGHHGFGHCLDLRHHRVKWPIVHLPQVTRLDPG